MRYSVGGREDLDALFRGTEEDIAAFATGAIRDNAEGLKADWRAQIEAARLGARLAKTVRSEVYPEGQNSVDAAALVWTKAPDILDAYARGATIRPVNGSRYLWVPTGETPKTRRGNALTPKEVEARFGRDLVVVSADHWKMKTTTTAFGKAVAFAGYNDLAIRKASGRWRNASRNEKTRGHRSYRETTRQFVIMFSLVTHVRVEKRLDLEALGAAADARHPDLLSKHWR